MIIKRTLLALSAAAVAVSLAASPTLAQTKSDTMAKDSMAIDGMAKDGMKKDDMKK